MKIMNQLDQAEGIKLPDQPWHLPMDDLASVQIKNQNILNKKEQTNDNLQFEKQSINRIDKSKTRIETIPD